MFRNGVSLLQVHVSPYSNVSMMKEEEKVTSKICWSLTLLHLKVQLPEGIKEGTSAACAYLGGISVAVLKVFFSFFVATD